jgi:hypothetical protein
MASEERGATASSGPGQPRAAAMVKHIPAGYVGEVSDAVSAVNFLL